MTRGTVCVAGEGSFDADIVIVGEAPGAAEEKTGKPFQGESGKILRQALEENDLKSVYITNVVKCRPPGNRTPTPAEVKECRFYLDQEIAEINPEYVISLGGTATKALFRGKAQINKVHGELIENEKVKYVGMPTFHPAYTLRDPSKLPGFENDIRRLSEHYYGEYEEKPLEWGVVRRGNLETFINEFIRAKKFAFDCETSGLFQYSGLRYLTAVVIALPEKAWVIPGFLHPDFQHRTHSPWCHGQALRKLLRLLVDLSEGKEAYAWNGKFDGIWLNQICGKAFKLTIDGMLAAHILNENTANDLTTNCRTFLGVNEYDIPLNQKIGKPKLTEQVSTNWKYCASDGIYTLRLVEMFKEALGQDMQVKRLFYSLVMPAARALEEIEQVGLTIDTDAMREMQIELTNKKMFLEKRLNNLAGKDVNWNSTQQVAKVIYEDFGLPCTLKTAKGNPSTSEEAILELKGEHKIADLLIEYRETAKFLSTYIIGLKQFMVGNKLHISYKIHGTVTGRYSSRIHSIPRDGRIRNLVIAPPGWEFAQGDISQAELRIIAQVSKDPEMIKCFREEIDMHWRTFLNEVQAGAGGEYYQPILDTASHIAGRLIKEFSEAIPILTEYGPDKCIKITKSLKEGRKRAKAVNFGYVYGMFPNKFIQTAKTKYGWEPTLEEAEHSRNNFFYLYAQLQEWHKTQKRLAALQGYVRTLSGRKRRLPGIYSRDRGVKMEAERQAINSPIQGFIGDYKAMVMVEIHETIDKNQLKVVGEHHDAVLMIVRKGCEDKVLPEVLKIMAKPKLLKTLGINLSVPMLGDIELGPWGKGKTYVPPE